jgi:hypothetical protein
MRWACLVSMLLFLALWPAGSAGQERPTAAELPDFLSRFSENFGLIEAAYTELGNEHIPLKEEEGESLGRRSSEDWHEILTELRQTTRGLAADPQDLVLAAKLVLETESLADDLFDLSQIAYDNDREELAQHLSDLQLTMDNNKDLLASYLLDLAASKQERLKQLEQENARLESQLKQSPKPAKEQPDQH